MPTNKAFPSTASTQPGLYVGVHLCSVLYGVVMYLYFKTMFTFLARKRARRKSDLFYALFSTVMFTLITLFVVLIWVINEVEWVVDQEHPLKRVGFVYLDVVALLSVTVQLLTDSLMIYRCRIVWDSLRAIIIPIFLWLATLGLGIASVWIRDRTLTNPFDRGAFNSSLAYYAVSVILTVMLTCMICGRLVYYGRLMKKHLGREHATPYFSTLMLIVESMLSYSLSGIALLGAFVTGSPAEFTLLHVFGLMMCISPQMLILRVAGGRAWQEETIRPLHSAVMFASQPGGGNTLSLGISDGMGSEAHLESLPGVSPLTRESSEDDKV